jgi:hypothetical protein
MENEEGCTIHLKVRMENDELVDKAILCPSLRRRSEDVQGMRRGRGPATRSWHVCYAEIRWRSVQQTKRWKDTWKRYGGRLRPTCFVRERMSRGLAAAPVTAPLFGTA